MKEKYVNGYFALSCLIINDFLLFKVLFSKFNKKVQSAEVIGVLIAGSFGVLSSRFRVSGPGFWVLSSGIPSHRVWGPGVLGSWFLSPRSIVPDSRIPVPGSRVLGSGILDSGP